MDLTASGHERPCRQHERHVRSTPGNRPTCATRESAEMGQLWTVALQQEIGEPRRLSSPPCACRRGSAACTSPRILLIGQKPIKTPEEDPMSVPFKRGGAVLSAWCGWQ